MIMQLQTWRVTQPVTAIKKLPFQLIHCIPLYVPFQYIFWPTNKLTNENMELEITSFYVTSCWVGKTASDVWNNHSTLKIAALPTDMRLQSRIHVSSETLLHVSQTKRCSWAISHVNDGLKTECFRNLLCPQTPSGPLLHPWWSWLPMNNSVSLLTTTAWGLTLPYHSHAMRVQLWLQTTETFNPACNFLDQFICHYSLQFPGIHNTNTDKDTNISTSKLAQKFIAATAHHLTTDILITVLPHTFVKTSISNGSVFIVLKTKIDGHL